MNVDPSLYIILGLFAGGYVGSRLVARLGNRTKEQVAHGHEIKERQKFNEYVKDYVTHTDTGLPFVHGLNDFLDDLGAEMKEAVYLRGIKKE